MPACMGPRAMSGPAAEVYTQRELLTAVTVFLALLFSPAAAKERTPSRPLRAAAIEGMPLGCRFLAMCCLNAGCCTSLYQTKELYGPWSTALWERPVGSEATERCCRPVRQQYEAHFVSSCSVAAAERIRASCLDSFPGQKSKGSIKLSPAVNNAAPRVELECPCMLSTSDNRCSLPWQQVKSSPRT